MHKLMIVDDSKLIRKKIARECDLGLFDVVCAAADGKAAISLFREFTPDLVTMDLTMPRLDGINCIKRLVSIDRSIKILVISALNDKEIGMEALEEGAMGFITKPFSAEDLKVALLDIMEED